MSRPEALTPERRKEQTRRYLLDAAAEVFAERGFERATLDEIAQRAGFTKGAVYSTFASKADLFLELQQDRQAGNLESFFAARDEAGAGSMPARITDVFRRAAPTPQEWMLWEEFTLYAQRRPDVHDQMRTREQGFFNNLVALLEQQFEADGISPAISAEEIAALYTALFEGLTRRRALDPDAIPDELFGRLVGFIDQAITATARRP